MRFPVGGRFACAWALDQAQPLLKLVALAAGIALLAACTYAQNAAPSAVVSEIHAIGATHYSDAQIVEACGLKPGDTVTKDEIQAAANRLVESGVFTQVNYSYVPKGDKIAVSFTVKEAPLVPVEFDNFPSIKDEDLRDAIHQLAPLFDGTAPTDGAELQQMDAAIRRLLDARHLPGDVKHQLTANPMASGMMMEFSVSGAPVDIDSLDYGEDLARASEPLRDRQSDLLHKPYSRTAIEIFGNEQILPIYMASGHLRVRFDEPEVREVAAANPFSPAKVAVTLRIEPGAVFKLDKVDWKGISAVSGDALANLLLIKPGDLADGMKLTASWHRVEEEYAHRGYIDAKVAPTPEFDEAASTVTYHVTVEEGPQYHMGSLVLTGLSLDAEGKLRSYWKLPPGAVFDGTYLEDMLTKLDKPSAEVFGSIPLHYSVLGHDVRINSATHTADVLLDFH